MKVVASAAALLLVAAACAGDDAVDGPPIVFADEGLEVDADPAASSTASTTTVPVAERLPPLATDVAGAVRSVEGGLLPIIGSDGNSWEVVGPCVARSLVDASGAVLVGPHHVVLDPGHGGSDAGAEGPDGLVEAELNLDVARRAAEALRAEGVEVVLTREGDTALSASARAASAPAVGAFALVSIHHRSGGDPSDGPGSEAWHRVDDSESRRLAGLVYDELEAALTPLETNWWAPAEPGVKYLLNQRGDDFHTVLRESAGTPAALVEFATIDNPDEAALLATEAVRQLEAHAVARAVIRFLVDDGEGRGFIEPAERVRTAGSNGVSGCS